MVSRAPCIGIYRPQVWDEVEPTTRTLVENAARDLAKAGADVRDVKLPAEFAGLNAAHRWISSFEFARNFTWEIAHRWSEISETLRTGRLADGLSCSFERYVEMKELAASCRSAFDAVWSTRERFEIDARTAAYILAVDRIIEARKLRGLYA